jgi:arylsulfatase A-like enzyme
MPVSAMIRKSLRALYNLYINVKGALKAGERLALIRKAVDKGVIGGKPYGSVIVIVVDCLRYRNLSFTGYSRRTTPFLDNLGVKLRAFSPSPHTYSSVPSILTGLYPHNHGAIIGGVVKNFDKVENLLPLRSYVMSLPEVLFYWNYRILFYTSIFTSVLPFRNTLLIKKAKIVDGNAESILEKVKRDIREALRRGERIFAYIHLGDLHEPLNPPEGFRNFFGEVKRLPDIERWAYRRRDEQRGRAFEEYKYNRVLLYDNTLRYVDYAIERFFNDIDHLISKERTLIIITADHGEEFWEHAEVEAMYFYDPRGFHGVGHGHNLFNEIVEVPLIILDPDEKVVSHEEPISSVDIVPTILDWLGLSYDVSMFDGHSLMRKLPRNRYLLSEAIAYGYEKKALINKRYKLIYSKGDNVKLLFDIISDPLEQTPIMDDSSIMDNMLRILKKILAKDILKTSARSKIIR